MLSYLHAFHAGNFADVHKHAALVLAVRMMQAKAAGIAFFDTHAGSASYSLKSERALKTAEADLGIQKVWQLQRQLSGDDWQDFLAELRKDDSAEGNLSEYPGSPRWVRRYLRAQDTLSAFELHPTEGDTLSQWASSQNRVKTFREDGLKGLLTRLPPAKPRLLVLIDPSYEVKTDYEEVGRTLDSAWRKCRHGVFLIWYPILAGRPDEKLKQVVQDSPIRKVLCSEIMLRQAPERGMAGSGMLVVNPPWGFDGRFSEMMLAIAGDECLGVTTEISWLVPE